MKEEGWYRDPFKRHTDRWFSDGRPTDLVRDDGVEAKDEPPEVPFTRPLVECASVEAKDGDDLRRADEPPPKSGFEQDTSVIDAAIGRVPRWPKS